MGARFTISDKGWMDSDRLFDLFEQIISEKCHVVLILNFMHHT